MAAPARRLAERFMPTLAEKLKQSADAKEKMRERIANKPKLLVVDTETQRQPNMGLTPPVPGAQLESVRRDYEPTGFFRNEVTWRVWNTGSGSTLTTNSCCDDPWHQWNDAHTITSGQNTIRIWQGWVDQDPQLGRGPRQLVQHRQQFTETPEQRRVREEQEQRYRAEQAAANARYEEERRAAENRRKEADDRAMKLLVSMLNDQQKADLKRDKHFYVEAPSGRLYRIDYGTHGNVKVVDRVTKKIIERLCIQPNGVPAGDANLMQKLMIETAEDVFRAHANITLEDGRMVYGKTGLLDGDRLAEVIPIRRAA